MARRPPSTRTTPPPGWPAWLVARREERQWDQREVFERVREHFGWGPNSLSLYGDIERGKRVLTQADKVVLAALYGKTPEDVIEPTVPDPEPGAGDDPDPSSSDRGGTSITPRSIRRRRVANAIRSSESSGMMGSDTLSLYAPRSLGPRW